MSPAERALFAFLAFIVVAAAINLFVVRPARQDAEFQREWGEYVTADNEGRPVPSAPPRHPQVARSLAHNRAADAIRARGPAADARTRQRRDRKQRVAS